RCQRLGIGITRADGGLTLCLVEDIDAGAVLGADVIALTHALGGVVRLEEQLEELLIGHLLRVIDDLDDLIVAGPAGARFLLGGIWRRAACIADGCDDHARHLPEFALGAPEAAETEERYPGTLRERPLEGKAVDEMALGRRDGRGAAGQSL